MLGGDIDFILSLWEATLISQNNHSPFQNHEDLHAKINATTLGDHPWQKITIQNNKPLPDDPPSWMTTKFEAWYCDPCQLVHDLISNLDFAKEFDYTPYQEHAANGAHCFKDFFSGNWVWQQVVWFIYIYSCMLFTLIYLGYD